MQRPGIVDAMFTLPSIKPEPLHINQRLSDSLLLQICKHKKPRNGPCALLALLDASSRKR